MMQIEPLALKQVKDLLRQQSIPLRILHAGQRLHIFRKHIHLPELDPDARRLIPLLIRRLKLLLNLGKEPTES